jgi:peptidoglycan/LPS O-acetylase OafA/YrhL
MMKARSLAEVFNPHHNGLTFLRLALAIVVIFSHSYEIGGYGIDPLKRLSSVTMGTVAGDSFFAISGFLITASFLNSSSVKSYLWKRCIRIFPGFWACLILVGLILCPTLFWLKYGTLSPLKNLIDNQFVEYVLKNFGLRMSKISIYTLFKEHPAQYMVNGSLWSLFPEFLCYLGVILAGWFGLFTKNRKTLILVLVSLLLLGLLREPLLQSTTGSVLYDKVSYIMQIIRVATYFTSGALLFLYRSSIPFSPKLVFVSLAMLLLCLSFGIYKFTAPFFLPYAAIGTSILLPFYQFGKYGNYSYGFYIYAYPIQQTIYFFNPHISNVFTFFALSLVLTLPLSWLSWHLIEQPCLKLKTLKL